MPLLKLENGCLAFGHVPLLEAANLQLDPGERIALIGRNGSGKSSLLAALARKNPLDDGTVWTEPGLKLGYVPQEPDIDPERTVFETVVAGMGKTSELLTEYHAISLQMAKPGADPSSLMTRMATLQHEMESLGAWAYEARAEQVISRFGLMPDARAGQLSGGQKKRLALAQALASAPAVLLLDEPTNHLDIQAIEWLEDFLLEARMTLLFITHDRRFLERLATRILELDRGRLSSHPGSYAAYQARKERELADEARANARFDKLLKEEESWIRQGVEARRTRATFRVNRLEQLRKERAIRRDRLGHVRLQLDPGDKGGQLIAELQAVSKSFGPHCVVRDFSCRILRGDRIGVIGPNGAGKTTLLRIILGELPPDRGTIRLGSRLGIAYFDQFRAQLDPEATLADVISPGSDYVEISGTRKHVVGYLGDFLFAPQRARSPVKSLSGGERNRLLLARLFARPANVLILDEPTNDLDIETLELLEALLQEYPGTVFLVSHDRAFLDAIVTQTLVAEGDGRWLEFAGGYADWAAYRSRRADTVKPAPAERRPANRPPPPATGQRPEARARLSWKEQRELEALPGRIATLEGEQGLLAARLGDPALYDAPQEAQAVATRLARIEEELMDLLGRWETLESRQSSGT